MMLPSELLLDNEAAIRLVAFGSLLGLFALLEAVAPRRARTAPRNNRWPTNFGILILDGLVVRFFFPILALGVALKAEQAHAGLLNVVAIPDWVRFLLTLLVLDAVIWAQHWAFHHVPWLWRIHRVHHADREIDVTTGFRFHPVEIALSMVVKMAAVGALGAHPAGVVVFEIILSGMALFNHANLKLSPAFDAALRRLVVTPDMHRVHHSIETDEQMCNFGFNLSLWDRLFATYRAEPRRGHEQMTIGLAAYQSDGPQRLLWSLALPFTRETGKIASS